MKRRAIQMAAALTAAVILFLNNVNAMPVTSAQKAVLLDAQTKRVMFEHNAYDRALIASTTKIMTGLIIAEECDLQSIVCVPSEAVGIEGSSIYLKAGELLSVEELLYGMMLHSGNDAAVALAIYCGGSVENFVLKMNRKADNLGLKDTSYENPHGLDGENNYSTAYDLAMLTSYAMENTVFSRVVSTKTRQFSTRNFTNHNKLLWRYEGAIGVKTGYTMSAGRILVSCAERAGRRLICVTLCDRNDWADHMAMFDFGFSSYENRCITHPCKTFANVAVIGGGEEMAVATVQEEFYYPVADGECVEIVYCVPHFSYAPVLAGDDAGTALVLVDGVIVAKLPLYWKYTVLESA